MHGVFSFLTYWVTGIIGDRHDKVINNSRVLLFLWFRSGLDRRVG